MIHKVRVSGRDFAFLMLSFPIFHSIFFLLWKYNVLSGGTAPVLQPRGKKFADEDGLRMVKWKKNGRNLGS